ncbi:uncharacterized protein LOC143845900 [Tasmannia lanceolata]|uniref:uncharacterized protein LOC143845900 n=1 Tax=Tasmannia lanceolata TaxID=3420 RepID=UPI004063A188
MKASLKFREDQKPLVRAKIPLNILGFPFLSGISAGDSKELSLNLTTFFESGPSLKFSYRPNDSYNPFSLVLKTGIGAFGSPISAPMAMSAEFSLLGRGNPSFFLQFKPQIGDFSIKKIAGSAKVLPSKSLIFGQKILGKEKDLDLDGDGSAIGEKNPAENGLFLPEKVFSGVKINGFSPENSASGEIDRLFSDVEVSARSVLPLRNCALLKFRWGFRFPAEVQSIFQAQNSTAEISLRKIPILMMNKISIEHVAKDAKEKMPTNADVSKSCLSFLQQMEVLQAENGRVRKAIDEIRSELGAGKSYPVSEIQDSGHCKKAIKENGEKSPTGKKGRRSESKSPEFQVFAGQSTQVMTGGGAGI